MQKKFAAFTAFIMLVAVVVFTGAAAAADSSPCVKKAFYDGTPALTNRVWRMEVSEDEAAFSGPSIHDRLANNWTSDAKRNYRWTSVTAPVDTGVSTELMTISAAVIGEGLPLLEKGDIVDVAVADVDYSQGRASVVLRRVCAARDEGCLDELRRSQGGKVSGVEIKVGDKVAGDVKSSPVLANGSCSIPRDGCRGEVAAALQ